MTGQYAYLAVKGTGLLCMKSMIERAWGEDER